MLSSYQIMETVAGAYGITVEDINGRVRRKNIAEARQLVAYFLRELNGLSYPAIGQIMERDHTTILHAYNKIERISEQNSRFKLRVEKILKVLAETINDPTFNLESFRDTTPEELKFNLRKVFSDDPALQEVVPKKRSLLDQVQTSEDILEHSLNFEITEREKIVISRYRQGLTLEEISAEVGVTRERVRQLVIAVLLKELGQKAQSGYRINVKEYIKAEKQIHEKLKSIPANVRKEILNDLNNEVEVSLILKKYNISADKLKKNFPEFEENIDRFIRGKRQWRWSKYYTHCRKCGTITIPHRSRGFCENCIGQLHVKKREKVLKEIGENCVQCGITREQAKSKYGRDLYVSRKLGNDNSFSLFCRFCFLQLCGRKLGNSRKTRVSR